MRLPTFTARQAQYEDARAFHEAVWRASLAGARYSVPIATEALTTREAWRQQGVAHKFWNRRGYTLRTALNASRTAIEYWAEPLTRATVKRNLEPLNRRSA